MLYGHNKHTLCNVMKFSKISFTGLRGLLKKHNEMEILIIGSLLAFRSIKTIFLRYEAKRSPVSKVHVGATEKITCSKWLERSIK